MLRTTYRPRVYLAGPMAGLTLEEAREWRFAITCQLDRTFEFLDPCRNKESLSTTVYDGVLDKHGNPEHFMCDGKTVFERDTHDIARSDALLVNFLGSKQVSVGTIMELGMAYCGGIPVVVVMDDGNIHDHLFTRQVALTVVPDIDQGLRVLRSLFNLL